MWEKMKQREEPLMEVKSPSEWKLFPEKGPHNI